MADRIRRDDQHVPGPPRRPGRRGGRAHSHSRMVQASGLQARVAVFRPGLVLSPNSGVSRWLRRFAPLFPCLRGAQHLLHRGGGILRRGRGGAVRRRTARGRGRRARRTSGRAVGRRQRAYTLLGANLPWRRCWPVSGAQSPWQRVATAAARVLSWLLVGQLIAMVVALPGETALVGEAMVSPHVEAAFDARTAVPLPSGEHRTRQGRGL